MFSSPNIWTTNIQVKKNRKQSWWWPSHFMWYPASDSIYLYVNNFILNSSKELQKEVSYMVSTAYCRVTTNFISSPLILQWDAHKCLWHRLCLSEVICILFYWRIYLLQKCIEQHELFHSVKIRHFRATRATFSLSIGHRCQKIPA